MFTWDWLAVAAKNRSLWSPIYAFIQNWLCVWQVLSYSEIIYLGKCLHNAVPLHPVKSLQTAMGNNSLDRINHVTCGALDVYIQHMQPITSKSPGTPLHHWLTYPIANFCSRPKLTRWWGRVFLHLEVIQALTLPSVIKRLSVSFSVNSILSTDLISKPWPIPSLGHLMLSAKANYSVQQTSLLWCCSALKKTPNPNISRCWRGCMYSRTKMSHS